MIQPLRTLRDTKIIDKDNEPDISRIAVDCIFKVHTVLGPGLLESSYETCLAHELRKRKLYIEQQKSLPIYYEELEVETGYRIDLLVERNLLIELKSVERMIPLYQAQMITYLKHSNLKTGLLVNFNVPLIKDGIQRISI